MRRARPLPTDVARQRGLVTRAQLRAAGWSRDSIEYAAARWCTVLPGVYLATDAELTPEVRAVAALLRWPDALLSHMTGAEVLGWPVLRQTPAWRRWLDLTDWPSPEDVHLCVERRVRAPSGFVVHHTPP